MVGRRIGRSVGERLELGGPESRPQGVRRCGGRLAGPTPPASRDSPSDSPGITRQDTRSHLSGGRAQNQGRGRHTSCQTKPPRPSPWWDRGAKIEMATFLCGILAVSLRGVMHGRDRPWGVGPPAMRQTATVAAHISHLPAIFVSFIKILI